MGEGVKGGRGRRMDRIDRTHRIDRTGHRRAVRGGTRAGPRAARAAALSCRPRVLPRRSGAGAPHSRSEVRRVRPGGAPPVRGAGKTPPYGQRRLKPAHRAHTRLEPPSGGVYSSQGSLASGVRPAASLCAFAGSAARLRGLPPRSSDLSRGPPRDGAPHSMSAPRVLPFFIPAGARPGALDDRATPPGALGPENASRLRPGIRPAHSLRTCGVHEPREPDARSPARTGAGGTPLDETLTEMVYTQETACSGCSGARGREDRSVWLSSQARGAAGRGQDVAYWSADDRA